MGTSREDVGARREGRGSLWRRSQAWIRALWGRLGASRALGLGAEMAFWMFLSLLPLAAVAGLVTARLAFGNWSVVAPMIDSLPLAMRELIAQELGRMAAWNRGQVGFWGGLMFVWLASSGIHSIFDALEIESEAVARPWWKKRLLAIVTCAALSVGVAVLTLLATGVSWLEQLTGGGRLVGALALESSWSGHLLRVVVGAVVALGLITGLYWIALPPRTRASMPLWPGASLAMGLQTVLGFGYGLYLARAGDGGAYQAGLAAIGVTLMALYLFCLALLVGVEVNRMLGERRRLLARRSLL